MSDSPTKLAPGAQLADDRTGENEPAPAPAVVKKVGSLPPRPGAVDPPRPRAPSVVSVDDGASASARPGVEPDAARKRGRMTLRIPDDEVARPQSAATTGPESGLRDAGPSAGQAVAELMIPLQPTRIIAIGPAPADPPTDRDLQEAPTAKRAAALGIDGGREDGWTPYQPAVVPSGGPTSAGSNDRVARQPGVPGVPSVASAPSAPSGPKAHPSVEIPIDFSADSERTQAAQTRPNLHAFDSEEILLDDADRETDPGRMPSVPDESEVSIDDLVSVESAPTPRPNPSASSLGAGPIPEAPISGTSLVQAADPQPVQAPRPAPAPPEDPLLVAEPSPLATAPTAAPQKAPSTPPRAPPRSSPNVDPGLAGPAGPAGASAPIGGDIAAPAASDPGANRKKGKPWWEELFNEDFIRTQAKLTDADIAREVTFIEESLGCEAGATVLDLACGTGRHAVELAARGYHVVGFDVSVPMLARASEEAEDRRQKVGFVQGDMREMQFEETFDGIFCWNTSFGFFDEEKNNAVIARVHRALKKGGQFLLDVANRDYVVRQGPSLAWFEGDGCICMDEMQIDFITSRMRVKRTLMLDDGRTKEIEYSIRLYSLHELGKMLHDNGFRVAEVSGRTGTPGVFFGCESPRTLILAEKR